MTSSDQQLKGSLHDKHVAMDASMGDEAGWSVPLSYTSAMEEAAEVHRRAGVFDVSHCGRIRIRGAGALDLLERVCTHDVAHQEDNTTVPSLLCNERGGIIDYARLIRLESFWVLVTSDICRTKVLEHLTGLAGDFGAKVDDQTPKTTMLAITGPAARDMLEKVLPFSIASIAPGEVKFGSIMIAKYIAEVTSFTGHWGTCVSVPGMLAGKAWQFITDKAGDDSVRPCGMDAMELLRIEAGQLRYGHELNETIDPAVAGLMGCVDFGHEFIGKAALEQLRDSSPARTLVGLVLDGNCIAGQGTVITDDQGGEIGAVTSGTFSPSLDKPIAMAYVNVAACEEGSQVSLEVQGESCTATITALPFVSGETSD